MKQISFGQIYKLPYCENANSKQSTLKLAMLKQELDTKQDIQKDKHGEPKVTWAFYEPKDGFYSMPLLYVNDGYEKNVALERKHHSCEAQRDARYKHTIEAEHINFDTTAEDILRMEKEGI